jgi:hypothetical protein
MTSAVARSIAPRAAAFATIPLLWLAAVFYNTRLAFSFRFLLPVAHFLPGRVDMTPPAADGG